MAERHADTCYKFAHKACLPNGFIMACKRIAPCALTHCARQTERTAWTCRHFRHDLFKKALKAFYK
ncbi:MAG: hypothetical protein D8B57_08150 [Prevotella sp.]|nr:MAG: hypothetical protein D8B57_08150 [Prevotella sp.]